MPEVEIRPAISDDLDVLKAILPLYQSSRVWQLDRLGNDGDMQAVFREVRLPRESRVDYPRTPAQVFAGFEAGFDSYLTAVMGSIPVGYIHLSDQVAPRTAWVKDWVVRGDLRMRGIGAALLLAALDWSAETGFRRMVVEMQSKNYPAITLVRKLGFEFSGFSDQFYSNQDIALFFGRALR
jgi:ribosomal protein S18 acetylase RimI-like enzyme